MLEYGLALIDGTADGRCRRRFRRASQRDMALSGQEAGGRIEADPSCARQVNLAPGMQIREVPLGAHRPIERLDVGHELDEITGDETRRHFQMTKQLDQQGRRIAARPGAFGQRFFGRLRAGFEPNQILNVLGYAAIELDDEIDGANAIAGNRRQISADQRRGRRLDQVGHQFTPLVGIVFERKVLRIRREKEVEGIEHRHLRDQIHFDPEFSRFVRKHQAREVIRLRILLPVDEVIGRPHLQRIGEDARSAVRSRPQTYDLRTQTHHPVVAVVGYVIQGNVDGQSTTPCAGIQVRDST